MVLLPVSDRQLIEKCLAEAGVCARCALRFTGEKYPRYYQASTLPTDGEESKKMKPNTCVACLGVLQDHVMEPLLDSVVDSINNSGYDADSFSLTLSVPTCLALRQHSLLVHLRQQLPVSCMLGLEDYQVVPIKQAWKFIYPESVASRISKQCLPADEADFQAEIQAQWEPESEELACMASLCPQEYATRARNIHVYNMGVYSR